MLDVTVLKGFDFEGSKKETIEKFVMKESKKGFEFSSSAIHELDRAIIHTYNSAFKKIETFKNDFEEKENGIVEFFFSINFDREPVESEIVSLDMHIFVEDVALEFEEVLMNARVETTIVYKDVIE